MADPVNHYAVRLPSRHDVDPIPTHHGIRHFPTRHRLLFLGYGEGQQGIYFDPLYFDMTYFI